MAVTHDYTLICEHARLELGGKFTIVGLYPNGIAAQTPPLMQYITFFNAFHSDSPNAYKFTGTLAQLDGQALAKVEGVAQAPHVAPMILAIPFLNLQFKTFGSHTWSLEIDNQVFLTEFQVIAQIPNRQA